MNQIEPFLIGIGIFLVFNFCRFIHKIELDLWIKSKLPFRHGVEQ